jgi:hypothetical protein
MGLQERLLGSGEVSHAQPNLPELRGRPADVAPGIAAELVACPAGLDLGLRPIATEPEDLCPVDPTHAVEAAGRVVASPALHGHRPFLRPVVLGQALERAHGAAVQKRRAHGIQLAGDRGDGGLIQNGQALVEVALEDQDAGFAVSPQDADGRFPEAHADVHAAPRLAQRVLEVAGEHGRPRQDDCELTVDGRVRAIDEEVLGPADPSAEW